MLITCGSRGLYAGTADRQKRLRSAPPTGTSTRYLLTCLCCKRGVQVFWRCQVSTGSELEVGPTYRYVCLNRSSTSTTNKYLRTTSCTHYLLPAGTVILFPAVSTYWLVTPTVAYVNTGQTYSTVRSFFLLESSTGTVLLVRTLCVGIQIHQRAGSKTLQGLTDSKTFDEALVGSR
jgi:hypothetical protein